MEPDPNHPDRTVEYRDEEYTLICGDVQERWAAITQLPATNGTPQTGTASTPSHSKTQKSFAPMTSSQQKTDTRGCLSRLWRLTVILTGVTPPTTGWS